jgi:Type I phosphodiesterase / nucleotide pyrophosphatase
VKARRRVWTAGIAAALAAALAAAGAAAAPAHAGHVRTQRHVLLLSIDGLHQSDLVWWVHHRPRGALAAMARAGTEYTDAMTPVPSDSYPGLIAQLTGGDPRSTGIYYDVSYNRRLLPPGSSCVPGQRTGLGTVVAYDESLDRNPDSIDAGYGLPHLYPGLPGSVLRLPGALRAIETRMIDRTALPISPSTCRPVFPHQYLRVNTVFGVAHTEGLRTAWSDKHPAYDVVNGPGGTQVDDLFTPEINSSVTDPTLPAGPGDDWTKNNRDTQFYDGIKVRATLNEIRGWDHSGTMPVGTPAIFGMNFQSVSTAQKLPESPIDGVEQRGGYIRRHGAWVPGPVLRDALRFVDRSVGSMVSALRARHLLDSTTIIVSAKHGQSPIETTALKRIDDGVILGALDAAWTARGHSAPLVAAASDDDSMYVWLTDRSRRAIGFARRFLLHFGRPASAGAATDYAGNPIGFRASGLARVAWGPGFFGVRPGDDRVPDLVGIVQHGVVYTGGTSKIAEHGGDGAQDRHVPILVLGGGYGHATVGTPVETTEIAPTILRALGLSPWRLQAVRMQHTPVLPG